MASYAAPTDMLARYDARTIGDLVGDENTRVSAEDLEDDENLLAILADASGMIDAALMVSNRYTADQLEGLTGNSLAHLKRITCQIAMAYCFDRRPMYDVQTYGEFMELANATLERLRKGENVFNLSDLKTAGAPTIDGPSVVDYLRLNTLPERTRNFFPSRAGRLPRGR